MSTPHIVNSKVEQMYTKAESFFGKSFTRPVVTFDLKGTTAGRAIFNNLMVKSLGDPMIKINYQLMVENGDRFLNRTVPHEVAHLVAVEHFGITAVGHGKHWKYVMKVVFGLEPSRCHSYDVTNVRQRVVKKQYVYVCNCREHKLTAIKHNRIASGKTNYRCARCAARLVKK